MKNRDEEPKAQRHWVVGLGSNLGDRRRNLEDAIGRLAEHPDIDLQVVAMLYETPPMGPPQPDYLNTAVRIRTTLRPRELLRFSLLIESALGRKRRRRWGPRTIDIDLLDWDGPAIDEPGLTVPHPGLRERAFVWFPYVDVTWRTSLETPLDLRRPELAPTQTQSLSVGPTSTGGLQSGSSSSLSKVRQHGT